MKKAAFILIMSIRLVALLSIILGALLWSGKLVESQNAIVTSHFALGFLVMALVFGIGIVGLIAKQFVVGALSLVAAICLPATGFMQIATIGPNVGVPQIAHVIVVLAAMGLAEATAAKIKRLP